VYYLSIELNSYTF